MKLIPEDRRLQAVQKYKAWGFNHSATELLESGIEFDIGSSEEQLLDINFSKGVIRIPALFLHETTCSLLRNLIAYEQCSLGSTHGVASYVCLMKSLISSSRDSNVLRDKGITKSHNWIGGEEEFVTQIFRGMLEEVVIKEFHFKRLCDEVNEPMRKLKVFMGADSKIYKAAIQHVLFFSVEFHIIMAALAILLLTAMQTYYAMHTARYSLIK